jgi:hypothetical protein
MTNPYEFIDPELMAMLPYIVAGAFGLIAIIILIIVIPRVRKKQKQAANFGPEFARRTGLQQNNGDFEGEYRGFPTRVSIRAGVNYARVGSAMMSGDASSMHGRQTFFQTFTVEMQIPGANFPSTELIEPSSIIRTDQYIQDAIHNRQPTQPQLKINHGGYKRTKVYGEDEAFASYLLQDSELVRLLKDWYYANIKINGDQVLLDLHDNNILNKYGYKRLSKPDYIIQACDICARLGELGLQYR